MLEKLMGRSPHPRTHMPMLEAVGIMRATALILADDFKRLCGCSPGVTRAKHRRNSLDRRYDEDLQYWTSIGRGL